MASTVDRARILRDQIDRLVGLGVRLRPIPAADARSRFDRFVDLFVDPDRAADLRARRADPDRAVEVARFLRGDRLCTSRGLGLCRWLAAGAEGARAVRFDRGAALPALDVDLGTLADAWAGSWPGVYVNFAAARAAVVTVDYEDVRCETRAPKTPYR